MKHLSFLALALSVVLMSSCSVMAIKKHQPNFKSSRELEKAKGSFQVADVKSSTPEMEKRIGTQSLSCRLTTFNMPADTTVAAFVKQALTDEFDAAKKLSESGAPVTVVVNSLESDTSGFNKGSWDLDFDYLVKDKKYNVKTKTEFESAYMADTACRNTANALTDAVAENFIGFFKKLPR